MTRQQFIEQFHESLEESGEWLVKTYGVAPLLKAISDIDYEIIMRDHADAMIANGELTEEEWDELDLP